MIFRDDIVSLTTRVDGFLLVCCLLLVCWPLLGAGSAYGANPFEIVCDGEATDISEDGSVVVGVDTETKDIWRWTRDSGRVLLGRPGGSANENAWGSPDVSDDGRIISTTSLSLAAEYETMTRWSEDEGWNQPTASLDEPKTTMSNSHAWGVSGDGSTLVGQMAFSDGTSRAAAWKTGVGWTLLESGGQNSRANAANSDGSVIVGWSENSSTGIWQPTVWSANGAIVLATTKAFCEAAAVNASGSIIVGQAYDESRDQRVAALWLKSDYGWVREWLGSLPGTFAGYGQAMALALTDDGHTIVGFNRFDPNRSAGFIWTVENGLLGAHEYLAAHGIALPEGFRISSVTGITADGAYMAGFGEDTTFWPHQLRSFRICVKDFPNNIPRKNVVPAGPGISNPFEMKDLE
jgi:uncharacterized membrane protein